MKRKRRNYDSKMLEKAINEVLNGSLRINEAAEIYGVPKSTLGDNVKKLRQPIAIEPKKDQKFFQTHLL